MCMSCGTIVQPNKGKYVELNSGFQDMGQQTPRDRTPSNFRQKSTSYRSTGVFMDEDDIIDVKATTDD